MNRSIPVRRSPEAARKPAERRVPWRLRGLHEHFSAGNRVQLLHDGRESFPAMLRAIAEAKHQILLEMYWFDSDRIGSRFAEALAEAARRGVEVLVIYDAVGSISANPAQFEALAAAGVRVIEFNPLAPWKRRFRLMRLTRRDHRKILVVDGAIGFTGGINIADAWLPEEEEGQGWRDDMVELRGPELRGLIECVLQSLRRCRAAPPKQDPLAWLEREQRGAEGQHARVLGGNFYRTRRAIARAYLSRIHRAEHSVWIANSYFVPDGPVLRAIVRAARRGVDVRILLPAESDVWVVDFASRAVWGRLLRAGVRIFLWTTGVLHAKTAVIDRAWSTIGTFNLDYLSLRSNLEVTLTVLDSQFGETMAAAFQSDLETSLELDQRTFRFRSLGSRLLEALFYRLRKLL